MLRVRTVWFPSILSSGRKEEAKELRGVLVRVIIVMFKSNLERKGFMLLILLYNKQFIIKSSEGGNLSRTRTRRRS